MPDPHDEPPESGEAGAGEEFTPGAGAFEAESPTREEIEERGRNLSVLRKPMGPPRRSGAAAFEDEELPPSDAPETAPPP